MHVLPFTHDRRAPTLAAIGLASAAMVMPLLSTIPTVGVPGVGSQNFLEELQGEPRTLFTLLVACIGGALFAAFCLARPLRIPALFVPATSLTVICGVLGLLAGMTSSAEMALFGLMI